MRVLEDNNNRTQVGKHRKANTFEEMLKWPKQGPQEGISTEGEFHCVRCENIEDNNFLGMYADWHMEGYCVKRNIYHSLPKRRQAWVRMASPP